MSSRIAEIVTLYDRAITILMPYFGESTMKFLNRQIRYHLSKAPEDIDLSDKEELAKWCRISSALLLDEQESSEEIYQKLISLD